MNRISNLLAGLNHNRLVSDIQTVSFQPGQILNGKIIRLFPNGIASLQVGSQKIVAQLEASLEANQRYWFQVQPGVGKVKLKVLVSAPEHGRTGDESLSSLLKNLHIPINAENMKITRYLVKEQLPVHKEMIEQAAAWLKKPPFASAGLEAIKQMVRRQLPMTMATFQAVASAMDSHSLTENLETLGRLLHTGVLSNSGQQLAAFIKEFIPNAAEQKTVMISKEDMTGKNQLGTVKDDLLFNPISFVNQMKKLVQRIGYTYEHDVMELLQFLSDDRFDSTTLKPLLLNYIREEPAGPARDTAEAILHKITGLQLLMQDSVPIEQFALQIPLPLPDKTVDLTMQWSGRRLENGQIDPAYCRILFYLDLEQLQETMVDLQVQNRIITLTIVNDDVHLKKLSTPYIDILKENLQSLNYTLSFVHFEKTAEHKLKQDKTALPAYNSNSYYSGVDIRI